MRPLALVLSLSLLAACGDDPGKDKTAAQVADAVPVAPAPAAAPAPAGSFALNGAIAFTGAKVTGKHDGVFQSWRGTAVVTDGQLLSITFSVDTASLKTDQAKLDEHLKGGDFFDVAKFATATFESTEVKAGAPADSKLAGATHTVTGNMTILGVSKSLTVPAKVEIGADGSFKALSEFAINRKDFNIVYPGKSDDLIKDDVALKVEVSGNTAAGTAAAGAAPAGGAPAGAAPAGAAPAGGAVDPAASAVSPADQECVAKARAYSRRIQPCVDDLVAARAGPNGISAVRASITVKWDVTAGRVSNVAALNYSTGDAAFASCVTSEIASWDFGTLTCKVPGYTWNLDG